MYHESLIHRRKKMTTFYNAKKIDNIHFAQKLIDERKHRALDVRSPVEYRDGTLFEAPNAPLRAFVNEFLKVRKETSKVILIGSKEAQDDLASCIRYAHSFQVNDNKELRLSYMYYEDFA